MNKIKTLKITNTWDIDRAIAITNDITFCIAIDSLGRSNAGFNIQNQIVNWADMDVNNAGNIALRCCELIQAGILEVVEIEGVDA